MSTLSGYTNNGYSQSMNGIVSLSDGNGTTIQNGSISTTDLTLTGNLINNYNTISNLTISYLYGLTGNIQNQINSINTSSLLGLNNNWTGTNIFNSTTSFIGSIIANSTTITPTVLSYISSLTSNAQTQINTANTNIASNTSSIATNTSNIASNTSSIATNTSNIASNTSSIATNTSNIASNTSSIATNTSNIATNTSNISTNTSNISALQTATTNQTYSSGITTIANNLITNNLTTTGTTSANLGAGLIINGNFTQNSGAISGSSSLLLSNSSANYLFIQPNSKNGTTTAGYVNYEIGGTIGTHYFNDNVEVAYNLILDGNLNVNSTNITPSELSFLTGTTSNIQNSFTALQTKLTNMSYASGNTTIANNLIVYGNSTLSGSITIPTGNNLTLVNGTISATNLTNSGTISTNVINSNSSSINLYNAQSSSSFPTISPNDGSTGFKQYWNVNSGKGDTALLSLGQGGAGGFSFYSLTTSSSTATPQKLFEIYPSGFIFNSSIPLSTGALTTTSLTNSGIMTQNNNFYISNVANFYRNIITSNTTAKNLGTSNVLVSTFVLEPYYNNTITVNSPVSLYRSYSNVALGGGGTLYNRIYDKLNSITYTVYKNGVSFSSGTCSTTNTIPNAQIYILSQTTLTARSYEMFITNAICSFTPSSSSSTSDTYTVYFTFSYTADISWQSSNFNNLAFGYYVNTSVSTVSGDNATVIFGGYGSNFASYSYSTSSTSYVTNSGQMQINDIVSNSIQNQGTINTTSINATNQTVTNQTVTNSTITTEIITTSTITNLSVSSLTSSNFLLSQHLTPAYMLDGTRTTGFLSYPITCSQYKMRTSDVDDTWIVYPRYKLICYYDDGYGGTSATIDNYSGLTPTYINSASLYGSVNQINSVRLYFLNDSNEITNSIIS